MTVHNMPIYDAPDYGDTEGDGWCYVCPDCEGEEFNITFGGDVMCAVTTCRAVLSLRCVEEE